MTNIVDHIPLKQDYEIKQGQKLDQDLEIKQHPYLSNEAHQIPRGKLPGMWFPTYIVFFAAVVFVVESGIIFIYTTIGLMKATAAPIILPAPVFPCQCPMQIDQSFTELVLSSGFFRKPSVAVVTQTILQTVTVSPLFLENEVSSTTITIEHSVQKMSTSAVSTNTLSTPSTAAAATPSSLFSSNLITALIVVTTTLPPSSMIRPIITVIEVISASV